MPQSIRDSRHGRAAARLQRGMNLIELMIVVSIVGILAFVALSTYQEYSMRAHRVEATSALTRLRASQENYRTVHHTYTNDLAALGFPGGCSEHCVYTISFTVAPDTRSFTARAEATPGGGSNNVSQTRDSDCVWFSITAQGVRDAGPGSKCWTGG
jgi:type IV pilus assembly protein PilE